MKMAFNVIMAVVIGAAGYFLYRAGNDYGPNARELKRIAAETQEMNAAIQKQYSDDVRTVREETARELLEDAAFAAELSRIDGCVLVVDQVTSLRKAGVP
jgi:NTP pyrophosphatase (non-canonical NTP hydrolase)